MERSGEIIIYNDCIELSTANFQEYLLAPGYSHSFLKSQKGGVTPSFNVTDKIMIGKIVDQILTDSGKVDYGHPMFKKAAKIAEIIKQTFGFMLPKLRTQVAFTGTANYCSLSLQTKGILDYLLTKFAVIDLKVTAEKDVDKLIEFMGYTNQLWHYARLVGVQNAFILIYSTHKDKQANPCRLIKIDVSVPVNEFWKNAILDFGYAATN